MRRGYARALADGQVHFIGQMAMICDEIERAGADRTIQKDGYIV